MGRPTGTMSEDGTTRLSINVPTRVSAADVTLMWVDKYWIDKLSVEDDDAFAAHVVDFRSDIRHAPPKYMLNIARQCIANDGTINVGYRVGDALPMRAYKEVERATIVVAAKLGLPTDEYGN